MIDGYKFAFNAAYGEAFRQDKVKNGENPDTPPSIADMLDMMSEDLSERASYFKDGTDAYEVAMTTARDEGKKLLGEAYTAVEDMLNTKTSWNKDKEEFCIQRYLVNGKVSWLCAAHAEAAKAEPFKGTC